MAKKKKVLALGEPWCIKTKRLTLDSKLTAIVRADNTIVEQFLGSHEPWMRRVVACVNACAGLSNPVADIEALTALARREG